MFIKLHYVQYYVCIVYVCTYITCSVFLLSLFRYSDSKAEEQRPILNVSQLNYASIAIVTLIILMVGIESGRNTDTSSTYVSVSLYCKNAVSTVFYNYYTCYAVHHCKSKALHGCSNVQEPVKNCFFPTGF